MSQERASAGDFTAWARLVSKSIFVTFAICGIAEGATSTSRAASLLTAVAAGWIITLWTALDARARGVPYLQAYWLVTFMMWPVAPAVHLLRTRGRWGLAHYFGYALVLLLIYGVGALVGLWLRPGPLGADPTF